MTKIKLSKPEKKLDKPTIPVWDLIKQKLTIPEQVSLENNRCECLQHGNTSSPSCHYNESDDTLFCHKCQTIMDSIQVYAILNSIERKEAIKTLAIKYKIQITEYDSKHLDIKKEINNLFIDFTKKCQKYLHTSKYYEDIKSRRAFTDKTMKAFKIGLFDETIKEWLENNFPTKLLKAAGFVSKRNTWSFAKRIVYPYLDQKSNPKYFIYRLIDKEPDFAEDSKYRKQIKTEWVKEIPFGLNSLKLHRDKTLIITEGITDAISVIMAGYPCLSPITVRIKKSDIEKMVNYCKRAKKIVVINDNEAGKLNKEGELDDSGLKGAITTIGVLFYHNLDPYISIIPKADGVDKIDLDEYLQPADKANDKITTLINNATVGIDFLIDKISCMEDVIEILKIIPENEPIKLENIIKKINSKTKYGIRAIRAELKKIKEIKAKRERRETEKKLKTNIDKITQRTETIPFNDGKGSIIQLRKRDIYLVTSQILGNNRIITNEEKIFDGKLLFDKKTIDYESSKTALYSFYHNDTYYITMSFQEFMGRFDKHIRKSSGLGRDVMKEVFNYKDKKIKETKAEYIMGWNDGWKTPQLEKENNYNIITRTDFQKNAYDKVKNSIKEYSDEEKEKVRERIIKFLNMTQTDEIKLAIIIGWCMAAPFKLFMLERFDLFPHLYMYGLHNTGKSSLAKFFVSKWYKMSEPLSSYITTSMSQLEDWLSTSTFPLYAPEISEIRKLDVLSVLKDSATGVSHFTRKRQDGSIKVKKPKIAALCFDANDLLKEMTDPAFNTKIIFLNFTEKDAIKNDKEWVRLARLLNKEKLFSFMYDTTKTWDNKELHSRFDIIVKENDKDREILDKYYPRLVNMYHIIKFGILLFEEMFDLDLGIDTIEMLDYLKGERKEAVKSLRDWFYEFILIAKDFEADYNEDIATKDGGSYQRIVRGSNPKWLTMPLIEKNKSYAFTKTNLRDFKEFANKRRITLKDLARNLTQSVGEDKLIKYQTVWYEGKSVMGIKIDKEFLKDS